MTYESERRKSPRAAKTDMWIDIKITHSSEQLAQAPTKTLHGKIDNLSDSGLCLISTDPFELGQIIEINSPGLPAKGIVVWTSQSQGENKAGIQFK